MREGLGKFDVRLPNDSPKKLRMSFMKVIRPMGVEDLEGLLKLVIGSGHGLTSLPKAPDILLERLKKCERSFKEAKPGSPQGEDYLFALEDLANREIIGVSGIYSKIGGFEPVYFYEIQEESRRSEELNITNRIKTLHLKTLHNGPSEICSLYLHHKHRKSHNGRFLSLSRFLFMADHQDFFEKEVFAAMRGMVDENGENPFWSAVGAKFFKIDFTKADYFSMVSKKWIKDLLPELPIYLNLLPPQAQFVIGKVHPNTIPAQKMLENEGFKDSGMVSLLEPGPVLMSDINHIRTIRKSRTAKVLAFQNEISNTKEYLISNRKFAKFRACLGYVQTTPGGAHISPEVAQALQLNPNDEIRFINLR